MGIKGFSVFLKHIGCEWEETSLAAFTGKTMAIDGIMYLYQTKLSPRHPTRLFIEFITKLKSVNIKPVFVMDGKYVHEKEQEQAYRAQKRRNLQEVVDKLSLQLEEYKLKKEVGKDLSKLVNSNINLFINKLSKTLNTHALSLHISKLLREVSPIPKHVKEIFLNVCDAFGIPVIWAKSDGEMLCATLNKLGKVDVVFSHDSDVFPAGAVRVIKQIDGMVAKTIKLSTILSNIGLPFSSFKDFCIMCGTDFNKRIPGLGPVTAYNLIKTHKTIEEIAANTEYNIDSINYIRVREIYSQEDYKEDIVFLNPDKTKIKNLLVNFNLQSMFNNLEKTWAL
uniref:DNA repair protein/FLAP endonuclease n=1 Tax=Rhinella marina erythrocytic-like virus TaxID=2859906 RepID=A0A8F6UAA8_9VIRU|nr:DNA repair protein/FLAP endonuclease [Rhinella marina erythrocytic-like virus]